MLLVLISVRGWVNSIYIYIYCRLPGGLFITRGFSKGTLKLLALCLQKQQVTIIWNSLALAASCNLLICRSSTAFCHFQLSTGTGWSPSALRGSSLSSCCLPHITPGWPNRKHDPFYRWDLPFLVAMQPSGTIEGSSVSMETFLLIVS
jgi:hypothetical protein